MTDSKRKAVNDLTNIQLAFSAYVAEETLPQTFQCRMNVHVWVGGSTSLLIEYCKNFDELVTIPRFLLDGMTSFSESGRRTLK